MHAQTQDDQAGCSAGQKSFVRWPIAWAVAYVVAAVTLRHGGPLPTALSWAVALAPTVLAVYVGRAYLKHLREVDELAQRIAMEALGWGFAAGLLASTGYALLEILGAPALDTGDFTVVMMVGFIVGQLVATRRFTSGSSA